MSARNGAPFCTTIPARIDFATLRLCYVTSRFSRCLYGRAHCRRYASAPLIGESLKPFDLAEAAPYRCQKPLAVSASTCRLVRPRSSIDWGLAFVRVTPSVVIFRSFHRVADLPNPKASRWGGGVTADEMREMQWVRPELVAQIRFVEWTAEGRLRHAAFLCLRSDKSAREVRREAN